MLLDFLKSRNDIRLIWSANVENRAATVSFISERLDSKTLTRFLANEGIMTGAGHFYAARLLTALSISPEPGVVRLSFLHYTSKEDVHFLIRALEKTLS